jgi:hypothetical protein
MLRKGQEMRKTMPENTLLLLLDLRGIHRYQPEA